MDETRSAHAASLLIDLQQSWSNQNSGSDPLFILLALLQSVQGLLSHGSSSILVVRGVAAKLQPVVFTCSLPFACRDARVTFIPRQ